MSQGMRIDAALIAAPVKRPEIIEKVAKMGWMIEWHIRSGQSSSVCWRQLLSASSPPGAITIVRCACLRHFGVIRPRLVRIGSRRRRDLRLP